MRYFYPAVFLISSLFGFSSLNALTSNAQNSNALTPGDIPTVGQDSRNEGSERAPRIFHSEIKPEVQSDANNDEYCIITFDNGSSTLTRGDRDKLKDLISNAQTEGKMGTVEVAAWADKTLDKTATLTKQDQDLADKRIEHINDYLKSQPQFLNVENYNMADRANWLARTLDAKDVELNSTFSKYSAVPMTKSEFELFRDNGDASQAVVVINTK